MRYINGKDSPRQTILIADDSEMNRSILTDMLGDEYEIIEFPYFRNMGIRFLFCCLIL